MYGLPHKIICFKSQLYASKCTGKKKIPTLWNGVTIQWNVIRNDFSKCRKYYL